MLGNNSFTDVIQILDLQLLFFVFYINKYLWSFTIGGNVFSEQSDLWRQFTQEVKGVCGNNFEITKIETSEVKHSGH